jgi:hypothetical protein
MESSVGEGMGFFSASRGGALTLCPGVVGGMRGAAAGDRG